MAKSSNRPMVREHNTETNEIVDREMTEEEFVQWETEKTAEEARQIEQAQKAADKAALLAQLGITEEQAKLLLS